MLYRSCISSVFRYSSGRRLSRLRGRSRCWLGRWSWRFYRYRGSCWTRRRCNGRIYKTFLGNMYGISDIMGFFHGNSGASDIHIRIYLHRNLEVRSAFIAGRLIFYTAYDQTDKFGAAEFNGCIKHSIPYDNILAGDLRLSCSSCKGEIICLIGSICHRLGSC